MVDDDDDGDDDDDDDADDHDDGGWAFLLEIAFILLFYVYSRCGFVHIYAIIITRRMRVQ